MSTSWSRSVGEATWARSLAAVAPAGRVAVCGATSGPNPPAALHRFWWKQLTVYGSSMGSREDFLGAYELVRSGRARVHVDRVFPLAEARAAHERLEAGDTARQDRPLDPRLTASSVQPVPGRVLRPGTRSNLVPTSPGVPVVGLEVPLALLAVDDRRAHAEAERRGRDRVGVDVERVVVVVRERVARQVVARVVLLPGGAAPERGLVGGLDALGTREQPAGGNAVRR